MMVAIHRALICLLIIAAGLVGSIGHADKDSPTSFITNQQAHQTAYTIRLTGQVEPGLQAYIARVIATAEAEKAVVVLDIETPGGRVDAALAIKNLLLDAKVPTLAYVNRHAISAGALIAISAEHLYMAPGGAMGAATPVLGDVTNKAPEKVVSAFRSAMATAAEARGRNRNIAMAMVDESIVVKNLSAKDKLLTLTSKEAQTSKFINGIAPNVQDALAAAGFPGIEIQEQIASPAEKLVRFITRAEVTGLLMTIGFLSLFLEFKAPGWGIAGLIALTCYALLFWGHHIADLAGQEELLLILIGIALILLEVLVIPGTGITGIAGLGALLYGLVMMMVGENEPVTGEAVFSAIKVTILSMLAAIFLGFGLVRLIFGKSQSKTGLILAGGYADAEETTLPPDAAKVALNLGDTGEAVTDLRPAGIAKINGRRVDVVSEGDLLDVGTAVKVVSLSGNRVVVQAIQVSQVT